MKYNQHTKLKEKFYFARQTYLRITSNLRMNKYTFIFPQTALFIKPSLGAKGNEP